MYVSIYRTTLCTYPFLGLRCVRIHLLDYIAPKHFGGNLVENNQVRQVHTVGFLALQLFVFFEAVLVGGLCSRFTDMLPGGSYPMIFWLWCVENLAMARAGLVTVVLVGIHGDSVTRRLRRDSPFREIFVAYVNRAGLDPEVTRFFHMEGEIFWGSTPGELLFPDGGTIHVVNFGWLFRSADLDSIDQWVRPFHLRGGFYC